MQRVLWNFGKALCVLVGTLWAPHLSIRDKVGFGGVGLFWITPPNALS